MEAWPLVLNTKGVMESWLLPLLPASPPRPRHSFLTPFSFMSISSWRIYYIDHLCRSRFEQNPDSLALCKGHHCPLLITLSRLQTCHSIMKHFLLQHFLPLEKLSGRQKSRWNTNTETLILAKFYTFKFYWGRGRFEKDWQDWGCAVTKTNKIKTSGLRVCEQFIITRNKSNAKLLNANFCQTTIPICQNLPYKKQQSVCDELKW